MAFWRSIALFCSALALAACSARPGLPNYGLVPDFTLTDQTGSVFESAKSLRGQVWIADFVYTNCEGPCPMMSSYMHKVQTELTGPDNVQLVSFTVDPARDTPKVLAEYASHFMAQPGKWFFLTGPQPTLHHLSRDVFKLGDVTAELEHSTRFVLIDRNARIRGFYLSSDDDAIPRLVADARTVLKERF
jgi:protein SCO1/2